MPELDFFLVADYVRAEPTGVAHVVAAGIDTIWAPSVPTGHNFGLLARLLFTASECGRPHRIEIVSRFALEPDAEAVLRSWPDRERQYPFARPQLVA